MVLEKKMPAARGPHEACFVGWSKPAGLTARNSLFGCHDLLASVFIVIGRFFFVFQFVFAGLRCGFLDR